MEKHDISRRTSRLLEIPSANGGCHLWSLALKLFETAEGYRPRAPSIHDLLATLFNLSPIIGITQFDESRYRDDLAQPESSANSLRI